MPTTDKNQTIILSTCIFLGENKLTQKLEWKAANQIYYIEDWPAYELLPNEIKSIIQPHFTNRDKNRFGQIGKKIGLDFKKTITQKMLDIEAIEKIKLWEWFPYFIESLAFVEVLLETNLDTKLEQIKNAELLVCKDLKIELYKDSKYVSTLDVTHRIESDDVLKIYINNPAYLRKSVLYSNILHDLLVEILGRDLHKVRVQLKDFYDRIDKTEYLNNYEVTVERIDEINAKLKGIVLTRKQSFWMGVMNVKNITNSTSYLKDETVDFDRLLSILSHKNTDLIFQIESIDFNKINKKENIDPLHFIFEQLKINLNDFNKSSDVKIDFKEHYEKQIEGHKAKYKPSFENKLHEFLRNKNIELKSEFQNTIDEYDTLRFDLMGPILFVDCEKLFLEKVVVKYPNLILPISHSIIVEKSTLPSIYRKNFLAFKRTLIHTDTNKSVIEDFIAINRNRSLLYFEETIEELTIRFNKFKTNQKINELAEESSGLIDLKAYINIPGATIEDATTESIETNTTSNNSGDGAKGKRIDGGKLNLNLELLGMVAEKIVFEKLGETHTTIQWVSKNAAKTGVNPEGSDIYGYDIRYVDSANQTHYIEVKGKLDDQKHFYISYGEYKRALKETENYHLYLVLFTLYNYKRKILHLGNIFMLNENDDIFSNTKFTANFNSLEIRFK